MDASAIDRLQEAANIESANTALRQAIDDTAGDPPHAALAVPPGWSVIDNETFSPSRRRQRGTVNTSDVASFARYVHDQDDQGAKVFIDADRMAATAVLNLVTPDGLPGHADHQARFIAKATSEYEAWLSITESPKSQRDLAEWMEDWGAAGGLACTDADGAPIELKQAVSSIRQITIEALRKVESQERQLSASRSAFESVEASSPHKLPARLSFTCAPFVDLPVRTFDARLSIITGDKAPMLVLRRVLHPQHVQAMANDLLQILTDALSDNVPALLGTWSKA